MPDQPTQPRVSTRAQEIRTNHHYGFRCGQWAKLLTTAPDPEDRDCYIVEFPDGKTDWWVVDDPDGQYEIREALDA